MYRTYVTDALYYYPRQKAHSKRFEEIIHPTVIKRDAEDIISEVISRAGITLVKSEEPDVEI